MERQEKRKMEKETEREVIKYLSLIVDSIGAVGGKGGREGSRLVPLLLTGG